MCSVLRGQLSSPYGKPKRFGSFDSLMIAPDEINILRVTFIGRLFVSFCESFFISYNMLFRPPIHPDLVLPENTSNPLTSHCVLVDKYYEEGS